MQTSKTPYFPDRWTVPLVYGLLAVGAALAFLLIVHFGDGLTPAFAAIEPAASPDAAQGASAMMRVLLVLMLVVGLGRLLSKLLAGIHQPPVIGEVLAGVMLGPSLLGRVWPEATAFLLPDEVAGHLGVLAQLGVILYMFVVGLELNGGLLKKHARATVAVSQSSIVAPFLMGVALALWLYPRFGTAGADFMSFALFIGVATSITAFPVLARILSDRDMTKTDLGIVALSAAALGDVVAWCLLALVVGIAQAQISGIFWVIVGTLVYLAVMVFLVRPLIEAMARRYDRPLTTGITALVFVAVLLSAVMTEWIGIHAIFGAFLLGAIIPHDSRIATELTYKLQDSATVLLLPAFFAFTGMRTRIDLVSGVDAWLACGVIIVVATLGKFGGALVAARLSGHTWRDASALGILMNTRGLIELVALNIGLDLGMISPMLFAMMVIMAVVTTMATTPALALLMERSAPRELSPQPD